MRGKFITLEGGEGVGKSTQVNALAKALRAGVLTCIVTREPGGSEGAEKIRELLLAGAEGRWERAAEALLFAAARADHVEKMIRPALKAAAGSCLTGSSTARLPIRAALAASGLRRCAKSTRSPSTAVIPTGHSS